MCAVRVAAIYHFLNEVVACVQTSYLMKDDFFFFLCVFFEWKEN